MTQRIRTVIAEDEPLTRARLERLLGREPDLHILASCPDGPSALAAVRAHRPDLLFLDVRMPGAGGFELLAALPPAEAPVLVFVTAFNRFAVQAFDVDAADYVLKPFDAERMGRAVARARRELALRRRPRAEPSLAGARLAIPVGESLLLLDVADVDYLTAQGNYVEVHAAGKSYLVRETLARLQARLDASDFLRIHRSHVIRLSRVREIVPLFHGEYQVTMRDGARLVAARRHRAALRAALGLEPG